MIKLSYPLQHLHLKLWSAHLQMERELAAMIALSEIGSEPTPLVLMPTATPPLEVISSPGKSLEEISNLNPEPSPSISAPMKSLRKED